MLYDFFKQYPYAAIALIILNIYLCRQMVYKIEVQLNKRTREALGNRGSKISIVTKFKVNTFNSLNGYLKKKNNRILNNIWTNGQLKVKQAGLKHKYSIYVYLFFQYIVPIIAFAEGLFIRRSLIIGILLAIMTALACHYVMYSKTKTMVKKFEINAYPIYKYLNNQISSGMRVVDAIKSVYLIVDDKDVKNALILLASRFELTNDIDSCLEELTNSFNCDSAATLSIALKQGIETGDSTKLIARQEKKMFTKFMYQIKLETDMAKFRSFLAVAMFCSIICIMIIIPLISDVHKSLTEMLVG